VCACVCVCSTPPPNKAYDGDVNDKMTTTSREKNSYARLIMIINIRLESSSARYSFVKVLIRSAERVRAAGGRGIGRA